MKKLTTLLVFLFIALFAFAETPYPPKGNGVQSVEQSVMYTKKNYLFALTEANLDKAINMIAQKDMQAVQRMMDNKQVFMTNENVEVYIVKSKLTKIQFRPKGHTVEFWTVREAISSKKSH